MSVLYTLTVEVHHNGNLYSQAVSDLTVQGAIKGARKVMANARRVLRVKRRTKEAGP